LLPVIGLQLRILYTLLCPLLVPPADMILRLLEKDEFISNTLLDKHATSVLSNNGLLVLKEVVSIAI
jgi:hypothetical protein